MTKRVQLVLASASTLLSLILMACLLLLTFYVPLLVSEWAEAGQALSGLPLLLANSSDAVLWLGWPLFVLPALLLSGGIIWMIAAVIQPANVQA